MKINTHRREKVTMSLTYENENISDLKGLFDRQRNHPLFEGCSTDKELVDRLSIPDSACKWVVKDELGQVSAVYTQQNKPRNARLYVLFSWVITNKELANLFYEDGIYNKPDPKMVSPMAFSASEEPKNNYDCDSDEPVCLARFDCDCGLPKFQYPSEPRAEEEFKEVAPRLQSTLIIKEVLRMTKLCVHFHDMEALEQAVEFLLLEKGNEALKVLSDRFTHVDGPLCGVVNSLNLVVHHIKNGNGNISRSETESFQRLKEEIISTPLYFLKKQFDTRMNRLRRSVTFKETERRELFSIIANMANTQADADKATAPHIKSMVTNFFYMTQRMCKEMDEKQKAKYTIILSIARDLAKEPENENNLEIENIRAAHEKELRALQIEIGNVRGAWMRKHAEDIKNIRASHKKELRALQIEIGNVRGAWMRKHAEDIENIKKKEREKLDCIMDICR
jgi:hypothetical protein